MDRSLAAIANFLPHSRFKRGYRKIGPISNTAKTNSRFQEEREMSTQKDDARTPTTL